MQHLEGSGTPVLYIGRTVIKRLKVPRKVQMRCAILRPKVGKNGVRGTKYK